MILTVDELREHVTTALGDDALQRLLDAAEEAIVARAGDGLERTERLGGGYRFLTLLQPAGSISSITERVGLTDTVMQADDFVLYPAGVAIERLSDGTNQRSRWGDSAVVIYTPRSQEATRQVVQIGLVELALNYAPAHTSERIGDWTETFGFSDSWTPADEREAILSQLDVSRGMVVV